MDISNDVQEKLLETLKNSNLSHCEKRGNLFLIAAVIVNNVFPAIMQDRTKANEYRTIINKVLVEEMEKKSTKKMIAIKIIGKIPT